MYKFSKHSRNIVNLDKVVLGNRETGQWVRISKEVYDILNLGIDNNISLDELKVSLNDDDDRDYIDRLYNNLCDLGIIEDKNNKQTFQNKIASIELTHRCNLKCIHCCMDADGVVSEKKDLSTTEVKNIFDKLIKWNPEYIMLSGGEPMLRKDFIELLTYLKSKYEGKIIISTNGTFINENNVDILTKCAYKFDISLDGVDEETCAIVRGPGIFDKVINGVKLIQSRGFNHITLSMAVADKNDYLEERFNKLNESLGTSPLVRGFAPVGRGKDNADKFSDKGPEEVYVPDDFLSDDYNKLFGICPCSAGRREIMIAYNGDLYPCPVFMDEQYKLGNIMDVEELSVLNNNDISIEQYKLLDSMDPQNIEQCKDCKVNLFCWTCPGEFEQLKENKAAFEDRCKKVKSVLYKRVWER